mmetsp:Transcript_23255/g.49744  ORF Transcript_23255/g.49744 Transcript_23255/m.49744 type:complete len:87 (-) Transcript_23255:170-430(-)
MYVPPLDEAARGAKGLLNDAMGGRADAGDGSSEKPTAAMEAADWRRASRRFGNDDDGRCDSVCAFSQSLQSRLLLPNKSGTRWVRL